MRRRRGTYKQCIIWVQSNGDLEKLEKRAFETICLKDCYHPDCPIKTVDLEKVS